MKEANEGLYLPTIMRMGKKRSPAIVLVERPATPWAKPCFFRGTRDTIFSHTRVPVDKNKLPVQDVCQFRTVGGQYPPCEYANLSERECPVIATSYIHDS